MAKTKKTRVIDIRENHPDFTELSKCLENAGHEIIQPPANDDVAHLAECGSIVVIISPEIDRSYLVGREIAYAVEKGIRIVGIWAKDLKQSEIPDVLSNVCDALSAWNMNDALAAVEGDNTIQKNCDGQQLPDNYIEKAKCNVKRA